jgi:adenylate cyclase class 2
VYEVEIKLRAAHGTVRERLAATDATREGRRTQRDVYYDAPHREFAATDEALRIRHESAEGGETVVLTYKGARVEGAGKSRPEHETAVGDGDAAAAVLEGLGFEPAATVEKEREVWRWGEETVVLDAVAGLGEFVEVEREAPEERVETAHEATRERLRELGLDPGEGITTSYLGLLLDARE